MTPREYEISIFQAQAERLRAELAIVEGAIKSRTTNEAEIDQILKDKTTRTKPLHWTQRPENKAKLRKLGRASARTRRQNAKA